MGRPEREIPDFVPFPGNGDILVVSGDKFVPVPDFVHEPMFYLSDKLSSFLKCALYIQKRGNIFYIRINLVFCLSHSFFLMIILQ